MDELVHIGQQSLARFLARWHGAPLKPLPTQRTGDGVDDAMAVISAYPEAISQARVARPHEPPRRDGLRFLCAENQAVWLWAATPCPTRGYAVVERPNDPSLDWVETGEDPWTFFLHLAVFEATWSARCTGTAAFLSRDELDCALADFTALPFAVWRWPGPEHRLWATSELLAFSCINGAPDSEVTEESVTWLIVAGRTPEAMEPLRGLPVPFEWVS